MKVPPCPRCGSRVFYEDDEWVCFSCGCRPIGFGVSRELDQRVMRMPHDGYGNSGLARIVHGTLPSWLTTHGSGWPA